MVKIITHNVRGLQNDEKRRGVFMNLRTKADIICIQESHSTVEKEYLWKAEWGGQAYWSHFSSQARGVAILISKNSEIVVKNSFTDLEGRVVGIEFSYKDKLFCLINVYAPNLDDPEFWIKSLALFEKSDGKRIIVGDFNTALNTTVDRSDPKTKNNEKSSNIINTYMQETYLNDVWRERNPDLRQYTYTKKKPYLGSRLDYILTDASLASWITDIKLLPGFKSDHAAVIMQVDPFNIIRGKGYWKLNNQVLYEMPFVNKIKQTFIEQKELAINLNPAERLEILKLNLIATAQKYCKERADDRKLILSQLEEKLEKMHELDSQNKLTELDQKIFSRTKEDFQILMDQKVQSAIFRSGAKYYNDGEKSSKYFFQLEKNRAGAKGMNSILLPSGKIEHDPRQIINEQYKFYRKLYTRDESVNFDYTNNSNIRLTKEQSNQLEGKITERELHCAIFGLKRSKCPGCDGLTSEFYAMFYIDFKDILLETFNYCFEQGELYGSAMRGVVNLIPKKLDVRQIKNMRPITLLPTCYKIVEKILANRLRPALEILIDQDQKGFLPKRRISCNIRRILDIIDFVDEEDVPGVVISIDFRKCFDYIEIPALLGALDYFEFGPDFRRWTEIIYRNPVACVSNNGMFSPYYPVSRSVKQGGPNSANYFLLLAEVLAIELRNNTEIKGFMVENIMRILGQYADDMDLYLWGEQKSINAAMSTIEYFGDRSGFRINYDKTTLYRVGSIKDTQIKFVTKKAMSWTNENINVLGVEITRDPQTLQMINYMPLIRKSESILKSWGNRGLSLFGKILVINTLIASLFVYKMTVLPIMQQTYIVQLEKLCESFFVE